MPLSKEAEAICIHPSVCTRQRIINIP